MLLIQCHSWHLAGISFCSHVCIDFVLQSDLNHGLNNKKTPWNIWLLSISLFTLYLLYVTKVTTDARCKPHWPDAANVRWQLGWFSLPLVLCCRLDVAQKITAFVFLPDLQCLLNFVISFFALALRFVAESEHSLFLHAELGKLPPTWIQWEPTCGTHQTN